MTIISPFDLVMRFNSLMKIIRSSLSLTSCAAIVANEMSKLLSSKGREVVFTEIDFGFNFGEKRKDANPLTENISERFANNSLFMPISAFLSYFPSGKSTVALVWP